MTSPQFGQFSKVDEERKAGTPELTPPGTTPSLTSIYQCSAEFLNQLRFWFEQNPPTIPISNIPGFQQFTAQTATTISTRESTTSATFTNLATVGPVLSGLPDGKYTFFFGASSDQLAAADYALMGLRVNSTEAVDNDSIRWFISGGAAGIEVPGARAVTQTLSGGGNNTVTARYRSNAGTTFWRNRWLIGLRYSNA